ncbi:cytochrome c-type biogenesis protein [Methylibium rhizosphaerae]|uniref:cytochrome c-type biogenesis protein n=1 Tax=Methylibium rhizosphaerae TaxID=2570323 RepID=UPI00112E99ED|nr:cytochrome c-type biogenesis protein [Methylibium rhizosphaerae]
MAEHLRKLWLAALLAGAALCATGKEAAPAAEDPVLEARLIEITSELRCLVCQNETIAASSADLANDLRREIRVMLRRGDSNEQILKYMTDRYGDFVLYRPPVKGTTALLWAGPALLLLGGVLTLVIVLRRRARLADDAFEPDEDDDATAGKTDNDTPARQGSSS